VGDLSVSRFGGVRRPAPSRAVAVVFDSTFCVAETGTDLVSGVGKDGSPDKAGEPEAGRPQSGLESAHQMPVGREHGQNAQDPGRHLLGRWDKKEALALRAEIRPVPISGLPQRLRAMRTVTTHGNPSWYTILHDVEVTVHRPGTGSFFGPFRPEECACPLARRGGQSP
jgi:hypothetical protein